MRSTSLLPVWFALSSAQLLTSSQLSSIPDAPVQVVPAGLGNQTIPYDPQAAYAAAFNSFSTSNARRRRADSRKGGGSSGGCGRQWCGCARRLCSGGWRHSCSSGCSLSATREASDICLVCVRKSIGNGVDIITVVVSSVDGVARVPRSGVKSTDLSLTLSVLDQLIGSEEAASLSIEWCGIGSLSSAVSSTKVWVVSASV